MTTFRDPEAAGPGKDGLVDPFARSISYLRVSLTDQCNLRCFYCTPQAIENKLSSGELLSYEELLAIIKVAADSGIRKVRLTGGEPLVRRDITDFIEKLTAIKGIEDVRITTNGMLLEGMLDRLYGAGIRKLNISLDTMKPDRFREITGIDGFAGVWRGIERALEKGFPTVKVNVVAMKGINDDEFIDFARLTREKPLQVRFIEFMPMGDKSSWRKDYYIKTGEIMVGIERELGHLAPVDFGRHDGPARNFRLPGAPGSIGFISPISDHFCASCNRLRLTAEGKLRSCLLTDRETDLKKIVREGGGAEDIRAALLAAIKDKPEGHTLSGDRIKNCHGRMSRIGG